MGTCASQHKTGVPVYVGVAAGSATALLIGGSGGVFYLGDAVFSGVLVGGTVGIVAWAAENNFNPAEMAASGVVDTIVGAWCGLTGQ